jgi:MYXO-CTERM domain-containing protein
VYQGCKYVGTAPRSQAKQQAQTSCGNGSSDQFCGGTSAGGGCAVHEPASAGELTPWALAALGIVVAGVRRRRAKA